MIELRPANERDLGWIEGLERECFSLPWTREQLEHQINGSGSLLLVACCGGEPAGYMGLDFVLDEGYVTKVRSEEDGRVFWLTLSDKMKVAYSDEMRIAMAVEQELDDKYTPQEMERFAEMLRDASRLLDDLDKGYNDSHYYEAVEPRSHRQIPRGNQ